MSDKFTVSDAVDVIYQALRNSKDLRINDVTTEQQDGKPQVILTTDNGRTVKGDIQTFVIDEQGVRETD